MQLRGEYVGRRLLFNESVNRKTGFQYPFIELNRHKGIVSNKVKMAKYFILIVLIVSSVKSYSATRTLSAANGNWNTPGHWTGGIIPVAGDDVVISGTGTCTIPSGSTLLVRNITINSGRTLSVNTSASLNFNGTLTINGTLALQAIGSSNVNGGNIIVAGSLNQQGSGTVTVGDLTINGSYNYNNGNITISGNLTNNGNFNFNQASSGITLFAGTATQTIFGTFDFNNLTVNTGANVTLDDAAVVGISGSLTLNGTATFDADGPTGAGLFTLYSIGDSPTYDGSIATLPTPGNFSGEVTVQRYISIAGPNNNRIYRYISSPVQSAPVSQLQVTIPVTGAFTNSSACATCLTNQSMFAYDETASGDLNQGFINFPSASNAETFASGSGYAVYIRGDVDPILSAGSAMWAVHGAINSGTINYPITYTNTGSAADDGWNLIGNPYPSTIDWTSSGWNSSQVGTTMNYIDNVTGSIRGYDRTTGPINGGSQYIATGQGFYVQANTITGTHSLSSDETVKAAGQQTTFYRTESLVNLMRIELGQGSSSDETVIYFSDQTSDKLNPGRDAFKMKNSKGSSYFLNLSSLSSDNYKLVVNSMGLLTDQPKTIALDVADVPTGSYQLRFKNLESFAADLPIKLVDKFTNSEIDVRGSSAYNFSVDSSKPESFGSARFTVVLGQNLVTAVEHVNEFDIVAYPNPTKAQFSLKLTGLTRPYVCVQNSVGQFIDEVSLVKKANSFEGTFDLTSRATGIYFIKVIELENGKVNIKKILKN